MQERSFKASSICWINRRTSGLPGFTEYYEVDSFHEGCYDALTAWSVKTLKSRAKWEMGNLAPPCAHMVTYEEEKHIE